MLFPFIRARLAAMKFISPSSSSGNLSQHVVVQFNAAFLQTRQAFLVGRQGLRLLDLLLGKLFDLHLIIPPRLILLSFI